MIRTYYTDQPAELDGGKFRAEVRLDIKQEPATAEGESPQWSALVVAIAAPISQNKFIKAAMDSIYGNDYEAKLINEYNAANLGIYTGEEAVAMVMRYNQFLQDRDAIKRNIERICNAHGIS